MPTLIHERVRLCRSGDYPKAICRLSSGWVVLGDVQFLRGYSLLLPDPVVPHLNAMEASKRKEFLFEMSVVGEVILEITGALRINYEMLGNIEPALHAHIFPRFEDEPSELRTKPVWLYDWEKAPAFDKSRDGAIMQAIAEGLDRRGLVIETR